jgi:hypothetical protein
VGSRWCNDECVLLECGRLWVLDGVMMSVFSSNVVDCGSRWFNDECVLLECSRLWVLNGVMMSLFASGVVDCGFSMV